MWISVNAMMNCCSSDGVPLVSAVRPLQQLRAVSGRKSRSSHFRRRALEERLPVDSAGDLIELGPGWDWCDIITLVSSSKWS